MKENLSIFLRSTRSLAKFQHIRSYNVVFMENCELTELVIPEGTKRVWCPWNNLKELQIPDSVTSLVCDPELFDYDESRTTYIHIIY